MTDRCTGLAPGDDTRPEASDGVRGGPIRERLRAGGPPPWPTFRGTPGAVPGVGADGKGASPGVALPGVGVPDRGSPSPARR
ncbi:hypothetical protein GCM10009610_22420 [Pseudonocardia xinjiangensis]